MIGLMRATGRCLAVLAIGAALYMGGAGAVVRADTAADCGRFFLKYDAETQTMKCVSGKRKSGAPAASARSIRREQRNVQRIINQVQDILTLDELAADQQRRVNELISDARQRVQQIRRQTAQLRQEQISYSQQIDAAARQRSRAQIELSRSLEQQQRDLVRQLEARQRQLTQSLQRRGRNSAR